MINEQDTIDTKPTPKQRKRPVLLTVLIVLSGIYIASSFFGITQSLINGPLSEEALEEELSSLYASVAQLQETEVGQDLGKMAEVMIDNVTYMNNEVFYLSSILSLFTLVVGAVGIFLMFKLKKIGFHIYIVYSLLPIITMYIITPMELILTFSVILSVIVAAIFAVLYGLNLKYMK